MSVPSRLNVVHIISAMPMGGVETNLLRVLPRLRDRGFGVRLVCTRELGELAPAVAETGIPVDLVYQRTRYCPWSIWTLSRYLKRHGTHIVQGHMRRANTSARLAAMLGGVPIRIATEHDMILGKNRKHHFIDRLLARYTNVILGVTNAVCEINHRESGIPRDKFRTMYLGLELDHLAKQPSKDAARQQLGIPFTENVIGFIGRLHEVKNVPDILRSMAEPELREANLVIVGDGPERAACEELTDALGIRSRVHFTGYRSEAELPAVFASFDVMVMASSSEGIATVQMEALAAGTPVVTTPVGFTAEALTDGKEYIEVPSSAPAELAKGLARALQPDTAARLIQAGRQAISGFSIDRQADFLANLYLELAKRHHLSGAPRT